MMKSGPNSSPKLVASQLAQLTKDFDQRSKPLRGGPLETHVKQVELNLGALDLAATFGDRKEFDARRRDLTAVAGRAEKSDPRAAQEVFVPLVNSLKAFSL